MTFTFHIYKKINLWNAVFMGLLLTLEIIVETK